ncbi:MAG TPA: cupin domain-containing protein, partial [Thermoanaerobaculia bacterium]|nr:cupin domain-containing protein [Thermoanaerobaculia bacterium]
VEDFFARYWEKTFLHLQGDSRRFSQYFSTEDVDAWWASTRGGIFITVPEVGDGSLTQNHRPRDISMSSAYAAFARGCSLVLELLAEWPALQGLVKGLSHDLHAEIAVEAFLTPQGARPYPRHVAGQDLFILHLEGEKVWHLHEFSLLQVNPTQKKCFKFPLEWYRRTETPLLAEVCLKPGDLLFIPRGMPYQAVSQKGASLHLRINVTPLFWMDFFKIAAECAALHSQQMRKAVPPGFVENQEICVQMRQTFAELMTVFEETSFDEVLAAAKRNRITLQGFPPDGHFTQLREPGDLTSDSEIERRPGILCHVDEVVDINRKTKSAIFFGHEHVNGPRHLHRAMEFIRDHPRFRVCELPGLDEKGQLVLVRRLIAEGLLRRATADTAAPVPELALP